MNREDVYGGLFSLLNGLVGGVLVTATRKLRHIDDVDPSLMPACYQNQLDEEPFRDTFEGARATRVTLHWWIYVAQDPLEGDPSTPILNPVVDAVLATLPGPGQALQINNVTINIERGKIQFFEGLLETKAIAKIELFVIAPFV
jgi:hypothetical protein